MIKGSDGNDYPDHLDYFCCECGNEVDPANCYVLDDGFGIVMHPDCRESVINQDDQDDQ